MKDRLVLHRINSKTLWVVLSIVVCGLLRFLFLDQKPAHFDEGINGWFVSSIWKDGYYNYDPTNFHGPIYFYFLQLAEQLFGVSVSSYRFMTGLFSLGFCLLIFELKNWSPRVAFLSFVGLSLSTSLVFYSRYAIHETQFVFFQVLFFVGYLFWEQTKSQRSFIFMTIAFFGAVMNKETFFIYFGTFAIALLCLRVFKKILPKNTEPSYSGETQFTRLDGNKAFLIFGLGFAFCLWIFSGFGMDRDGIGNFFKAFAFWTKTGTSTGHAKPFYYWMELNWYYEALVLISILFLPLAAWKGHRIWRLSALLGFGQLLAYSIIPYKTPWLNMSFVWPLIVHFSFSLDFILSRKIKASTKKFIYGVCVLLFSIQTYQSIRLSFFRYEDPKEKYVYVQSRQQFWDIYRYFLNEAQAKPSIFTYKVSLTLKDEWPLPWLFEKFTNVDFSKAVDSRSDILISDVADKLKTIKILGSDFVYLQTPLREARADVVVFVRKSAFGNLPFGFKSISTEAL